MESSDSSFAFRVVVFVLVFILMSGLGITVYLLSHQGSLVPHAPEGASFDEGAVRASEAFRGNSSFDSASLPTASSPALDVALPVSSPGPLPSPLPSAQPSVSSPLDTHPALSSSSVSSPLPPPPPSPSQNASVDDPTSHSPSLADPILVSGPTP